MHVSRALARRVGASALIVSSFGVGCGRAPARERLAAESSAPSEAEPAPIESAVEASPGNAPSAEVPSAIASAEASASAAPGSVPGTSRLVERTIDAKLADGPLYFTPAFDGSQRFSLWLEVMRFSRNEAKARGGVGPHFTFFVNACYYSTTPGHSEIGRARTQAEVLVRRALTQQAINEGHDIGSHGVGHEDGREWSVDQWRSELDKFGDIMALALFTPIADDEGGFVFPRFAAAPGAGKGETGASCTSNDDCASHECIDVTAKQSFCTQPCNLKKACPDGTACGSPMFVTDTDVCLPKPAFPVEYQGKTLFFANGTPNFKHPALKPYKVAGYRVPFLASNDALYEALLDHGFEYDTSQASAPKPPYGLSPPGDSHALVEFALMPHPGARTIPMDYNYRLLKATPERMKADYTSSLLHAQAMGKVPWNVGHHFATWDEGAYLKVLEETVRFALDGCPGDDETKRCKGAEVVSFRDLLGLLKAKEAVPPGWKKPAKPVPAAANGAAPIPSSAPLSR